MLRPAAVIWSKVPVIDTFGAGGGVCAKAGSAGIATTINASTAMTRRLLLITASSVVVRSIESCASTQRRHHQQLQLRSRDRSELSPRGISRQRLESRN